MRCGGDDDRSDDTGGDGGHDVVAVDLTPLIAGTRLLKVIGAVVDGLAAVPVVVIHVVAVLPFLVLNVLLLLAVIVMLLGLIVMVVLLSDGRERRATDAEEDARGESFLEQDVTSELSDEWRSCAVVLAT